MELLPLSSTALAFFVIAASPGPATLSNAAIAMSYGRKPSLVYGLGLSCGLIFWGLIAVTGMGALLQSSIYLLTALKVFGGAYLLWLAYLSARSSLSDERAPNTANTSRRWFLRGLLLNMSNPKSVIAWMAALSIGLDGNASASSLTAPTIACIAVGFITNALYSFIFSVEGVMISYTRFRRRIEAITATIFTVSGLGMIRSAFSN
ncbi:LysE family translocator [Congregibacter sp.]|uniref:LysE family translocator n=1 Tax=Congregibacter sp. TaxID=2744308 RepID=UPI00385EE2F5